MRQWHKPDPAVWKKPDMRVALTAHDFGGVFRMLNRYGLSQRRIAVLPGRVSRRFPTTSTAGGGSLTLQTVVDEPSHGSSSAHTVIRSLSPDAPGWGAEGPGPCIRPPTRRGHPPGRPQPPGTRGAGSSQPTPPGRPRTTTPGWPRQRPGYPQNGPQKGTPRVSRLRLCLPDRTGYLGHGGPVADTHRHPLHPGRARPGTGIHRQRRPRGPRQARLDRVARYPRPPRRAAR